MAIDANVPGPEEPLNDDYVSIFIEDFDTVASLGDEKVKFFTVFFDDGHTYNAFPSVPNNTAKLTPAEQAFEESAGGENA